MKPRILVIDDEAAIRDSLRMILEYEHYEFVGASSGAEGLGLVQRDRPDLVLLDIKMPGMDGMEVLRKLRALDDTLPVVMISGHGTTATAVEAIKAGATDYLDKPLGSERVIVTLYNALKQRELRQENRELKLAMEAKYEIVGKSPGLMKVLDAVRRAAPTDATVLLLGESGVGKELVARAIHRNSRRAAQRFVQVNCAAIPEELIESELFGHEKGSFTGATEKQIGKFEQADRGTIFLDEVGDMSQKTQAKVLRVLQEQEVERLGSARTIKVDVRVIAATNKNLEDAIQRGDLREDLYFRLNVIPIVVPPLRERREDIPLLAEHFARRFSDEHNVRRRFDARALEAMQSYRWRGNIRELRNAVERLVIMSDREVIGAADLPGDGASFRAGPATESSAAATGPAVPASPPGNTLREFKDAAERAFLVQKLRENNWNISKTAEVIDTPRSNLYKKLEQYGIKQELDG
ncbi:MAG: sigma-54-dependent transcriptional regulator [Vicinamibacterales bacterium]